MAVEEVSARALRPLLDTLSVHEVVLCWQIVLDLALVLEPHLVKGLGFVSWTRALFENVKFDATASFTHSLVISVYSRH